MSKLTKKCYAIAKEFHKGQYDRGGNPYIEHVKAVAEKMSTEETRAAALLHDILEDTECSAEDLLRMGIPEQIVQSVLLLTRVPEEDYEHYIRRLAQDPIARKVKIGDLEHNMDLSRLSEVTQRDIDRVEKRYKKYYSLLKFRDEVEEELIR